MIWISRWARFGCDRAAALAGKRAWSIIKALGTENFPRLRVGIGRPPGQMEPTDYVLQNFSAGQEKEMVFAREQRGRRHRDVADAGHRGRHEPVQRVMQPV